MQGKLIIISAPSGAGKTTLVKYLLSRLPGLDFSVSACSRPKRPHEVDGRDYYFVSAREFREKIKNDEFIEWEEVYQDHFYGTLKSEVDRIWEEGRSVVFDVDVVGGLNIKKQYGSRALAVFIMPPSIEELKKRLMKRSTESKDDIDKRLGKAVDEMKYSTGFDALIVNDDLDQAKKEVHAIVTGFLKRPL